MFKVITKWKRKAITRRKNLQEKKKIPLVKAIYISKADDQLHQKASIKFKRQRKIIKLTMTIISKGIIIKG